MIDNSEYLKKPNLFKRIVHDPVAIVSLLIGIIGIIVAIVVPLNMREKRELVYSINPVRTQIVNAGKATGLDILFKGQQLGNEDVTAVQIAIWNSGDLSIRPENILKEIEIRLDPPVQILETSFVKYYREQLVTGLEVITSPDSLKKGMLSISWKILETNDGGIIQLIYLGSPYVKVCIDGLIEGAVNIGQVESGIKIKSPTEQYESQRAKIWVYWIIVIMYIAVFIFMGREIRNILKSKKITFSKRLILLITSSLISFSIGALIFLIKEYFRQIGPPFGF